jgi:glutamate-1-semialdehyde 2,1-aminomutase
LDFYNNASSLIHGHAHPGIVTAIEEQARRGTAFSLPVEGQIELAEVLCDRIASAEQVRFVNSGSEAILLAIKVARAITGRPKIAKFEGLYHGCADSVEVSLDPDPETWGSQQAPVSVPYARATPSGVLDSVIVLPFNDVGAAEAILGAHANQLAGVILDVLPLRLGATPAEPEWLAAIRRLTRDLGILLISDEVVTFRLDYGGPQASHGFEADLTVLGKTIGGGLPVGALAGPRDVMDAFNGSSERAAVPNAGTFNANPLTLAAGIAALAALPASEVQRINELGDSLRIRADSAFAGLRLAAHTTGIGSLFGIHMTDHRFQDYRQYWYACVADRGVKLRQRELYDGLRERGILLTAGGVGAVSTAMTGDEIDVFLAALLDTVGEMQREGRWAGDSE